MSLLKLKTPEEESEFIQDFKQAILFTEKLNEIDVEGVEPLENVLDFYGGNSDRMRSVDDDGDRDEGLDNLKIMKSLNKNMRGNLCIAPKAFFKDGS